MAVERTPLEVRFWRMIEKTETCWLWTGAKKEWGHGVMNSGGRNGKSIRVHRLSWEMHNGVIPEGLFVCHRCDVPNCVNPDHLFVGSHQDNMTDCKNKGRYDRVKRPKGERHGMAKLSAKQAQSLRDDYDTGSFTLHQLGAKYGISHAQAQRIGKRLAHKA